MAELASASAMVLASVVLPNGQMEGIPVALMEAMAIGCPVISTRLSGIPELVSDGETGRLTAPGNPPELARVIGEVLDDPCGAQAMASIARLRVQADFDLEIETGRLAKLFAQLAGGANGLDRSDKRHGASQSHDWHKSSSTP
jgi:colanic acid/amylovoran biosynthesis glycosyltransferase